MRSSNQVSITFPDLSPDRASMLARELEHELLRAGVSRGDIRIARDRADTQDMGATVVLAAGAYLGNLAIDFGREFAKGVANRAGREALGWLLKKWGTRAVITMSTGSSTTIGESAKGTGRAVPAAVHQQLSQMKSLGLVILGASAFPKMPADKSLDNPAFKWSAELAKRLFSPQHTVFRDVAVLDLFDQDLRTDEIVDRIEEHVTANPDIRDVVIYYCGHGDFQRDRNRSYYLLLRGTQIGREPTTSLKLDDFRYMIEHKERLIDKRCYMVLDCCFAGAAVEVFQGDPGTLVANQVDDMVVPGRGWAFLTASDRSLPAIGDDKAGFTMFTGALGDVLLGRSGAPARMTLGDLCEAATRRIKAKHGVNAAIPQCHAPRQDDGDVSRIPLFLVDDGQAARQEPPPVAAPVQAPPVQAPTWPPSGSDRAYGHAAPEPVDHRRPPVAWGGQQFPTPQGYGIPSAAPSASNSKESPWGGKDPRAYDFAGQQPGPPRPAPPNSPHRSSPWGVADESQLDQGVPERHPRAAPLSGGYAFPQTPDASYAPPAAGRTRQFGQFQQYQPGHSDSDRRQDDYEDEEEQRRGRSSLSVVMLLIGAIVIGALGAYAYKSWKRSPSHGTIMRSGGGTVTPARARPWSTETAPAPQRSW